jgi:membrane-bound ClpP family serine protease
MTLVIRSRGASHKVGAHALVDHIGEVRTALDPTGTVFIRGEYWTAESDTPVEAGREVRITGVDGMKLRVEAVANQKQHEGKDSS